MKCKIASIFAIVLILFTVLATGAMAASPEPAVTVRVNGMVVAFPDGQPYVDANSRTMIPVRFVTEQLGAKVSWDGKTQTAVIEKNGIRIDIPIGDSTLKVTEGGKVRNVQMDTEAVLKEGRTYVPIRFVAEALSAYVDYSDAFKTVGIYLDELTAEEIATLRGYAYTQPEYAISYEEAKAMHTADDLAYYYGTQRDSFTNFANAHEYLYHTLSRIGKYYFKGIETIMDYGNADDFYANVVKEAIAEVSYHSERLTVTFRTDNSCIYQADAIDSLTTCVRGIVTARLSVKATELIGAETAMLCNLGYTQLYKDVDMSIPVDVHMNTTPEYRVNVHTFVALDKAQGEKEE
jgi:hypothetical protein